MKKIIICGGHLTCAQALIEQLAKNKDIEIIYVGRKFATEGSQNLSAEFKSITSKKIKFYQITTGRLQRRFTKYTLWSIFKTPLGFVQSFYYLIAQRPKVVVSFGGYVSVPLVFSAWLLGIPSITHEQTLKPGLANKINSLFCEKVYISDPSQEKTFPAEKTICIGTPIRQTVYKKEAKSKEIQNFIERPGKLIYITGGSQGSHHLNEIVFDAAKRLSSYKIIHQLGATSYEKDYKIAQTVKNLNYKAVEYLEEGDIGAVLNRADLVIGRSGANTVWELAVLAKVSILVPLPISAENEQYQNAKFLKDAGSAIIIEQKNLTAEFLISEVKNIFGDYSKYQLAAHALQKKTPRDSVVKLAAEVLKYT